MRHRQGRLPPTILLAAFILASLVFGLFWIVVGDVAAQRPPRRPVWPGRPPGMDRGLPGRNPAAPVPAAPATGDSVASRGTSAPLKNLADPNSRAPDL
jgi:hypothetical protein